jgi:hypothetical protein
MKNFYDLLTWRDAAKNSFPERLFFDLRDEFFGDLKIYICFKQRQTHLSQGGFNIRFTERAMAAQFLENFLKLFAELWKHHVTQGGAVSNPPHFYGTAD